MVLRTGVIALLVVLGASPRPSVAREELRWGLDVTYRFAESRSQSQASLIVFPRDESLPGGSYGLAGRLGVRITPKIVTSLQYEFVPHRRDQPEFSHVSLTSHMFSLVSEIRLPPDRNVRGALVLSAGVAVVRGTWMGPDLRGRGPLFEARLSLDPFSPRSRTVRPFFGYRFSKVFHNSVRGEPAWPSPDLDFGGLVIGLSLDGGLGG